jgi:hypothetical protein
MATVKTVTAVKRAGKEVTLGRLLLGEWVSVPVWASTYTATSYHGDGSRSVREVVEFRERLPFETDGPCGFGGNHYRREVVGGFVAGVARFTGGSAVVDVVTPSGERVSVRFSARGRSSVSPALRMAGPAAVRVVRPFTDEGRRHWVFWLLGQGCAGRTWKMVPMAETVRAFGADVLGSQELADTIAGLADGWGGSVADLIETAEAL